LCADDDDDDDDVFLVGISVGERALSAMAGTEML
jgi:hypothetical protein